MHANRQRFIKFQSLIISFELVYLFELILMPCSKCKQKGIFFSLHFVPCLLINHLDNIIDCRCIYILCKQLASHKQIKQVETKRFNKLYTWHVIWYENEAIRWVQIVRTYINLLFAQTQHRYVVDGIAYRVPIHGRRRFESLISWWFKCFQVILNVMEYLTKYAMEICRKIAI